MSDVPITKYRSRKPPNPYLTEEWVTAVEKPESPLSDYIWLGNAENNEVWREIKARSEAERRSGFSEIKAERGAKCEICGRDDSLDLHHIKARRYGGKDTKENAQLLCERCHVQVSSYGDR